MVTSQWAVNIWLSDFLSKVLSLVKEENIFILLKPHPGEIDQWRSVYGKIINHPRLRVVTDREIDLYEALIASDIHATISSTVFYESLSLCIQYYYKTYLVFMWYKYIRLHFHFHKRYNYYR